MVNTLEDIVKSFDDNQLAEVLILNFNAVAHERPLKMLE